MAGNSYVTMAAMMSGNSATAPIPTQTFNAANFIGTPVPMVGDNAGRPSYAAAVGAPDPKHVVLVAVAFIGIGYLVYHLNFEK
jgi:hypothetical protein